MSGEKTLELLNQFTKNHKSLLESETIVSGCSNHKPTTSRILELTVFMDTYLTVKRLHIFNTIEEIENLYKHNLEKTYLEYIQKYKENQ